MSDKKPHKGVHFCCVGHGFKCRAILRACLHVHHFFLQVLSRKNSRSLSGIGRFWTSAWPTRARISKTELPGKNLRKNWIKNQGRISSRPHTINETSHHPLTGCTRRY